MRCLAAAAVHAAITLLHCGVHFGSLAIVLPPAPSPAICKTLDIHSCSAHKQAGKTDMNQTCPEVCSAQKGDEESRCYVPAGMRTHAALCLLIQGNMTNLVFAFFLGEEKNSSAPSSRTAAPRKASPSRCGQ